MNHYKHVEWLKFREEVIALDGTQCIRCKRSRVDGAVLQVHHKVYWAGRLPWQYRHDECETLCKGCHAQEHGKIKPQSEWVLVGTDDLGGLNGNCEDCGTELRYVFAISHPKWGALAVGTDCCDRLTQTNEASEHQNKFIKAREAKGRFLASKRWRQSGLEWHISRKGIAICIEEFKDYFRLTMDGVTGKVKFPSLVEAKLKAFEFIESGEAATFFESRRDKALAQHIELRRQRLEAFKAEVLFARDNLFRE